MFDFCFVELDVSDILEAEITRVEERCDALVCF